MIITATDMYNELLHRVNKDNTVTIFPDQATKLLNEAALSWVRENAKMLELNQKQTDDLQGFIQDTQVTLVSNTYDLTTLTRYFRFNNLMVKISDVDPCVVNIEWHEVHKMPSDMKTSIMSSSFRKPLPTKLYYRIRRNNIEVSGGTVTDWWITYLSYFPTLDLITSPLAILSYYSYHILDEIVDEAVRIYIEETEGQRYRTLLAEKQIKERAIN